MAGRVFVGRERELETIRAAVGEAASGRFGVVLIAGEPGVGKTRLADMALQSAAELGVTVARGIASDGEVAAPYLPWRQVLRSIPGAAELAHAAGLSSLFPELGATGAGPADDRLSMFDAVVGVLSQLAGGGGVVVVLEDLQWADEPTLRALVHVARARPPVGLLVVGTYRDTELIGRDALTAALGELSLQSDVTRLRLAGLDAGEVAALVAAIGPDNLARLAEIDRRSGGNPFFVMALAELATSSAIPSAVRDVVRGRMRRLTPWAQPIVAAAATLGEDLDPLVVSAAVEQPVDRVLAAFDEAQEVGILRRAPSRQFTHDLIRECAEADLPTARRAGIHRAAARYLAGRSDAAERMYEIANHHLAAIPAVDADEAMRWVLRAAGAAIDRLAWETAEALLTRVAAGGLDVSLLDRIEAYRLLAVARCRSFDLAGAEVALRSAVELAEVNSCGSEVLAGLLLTVEGMADPDWLPWLREAVRRVLARADHPTAVAARLTAELAFQEAFFDQQAAGVLSLRSSELADQSADLAAQRASWRAQHFVSSGPEGVRRRLELADRIEASAREDGDPEAAMWGRLWRFDALLQLGDIAGAEQQAARLNRLAGLGTSSSARWHTLRCAMTLAMARGRFDDALEAAGQAFALAAATGNRAIAGLSALPVVWVSAMTGRHELAEPLVGELGRSRYEYAAVVLHWWSIQTGEKVAASDGYDLRPVLEEAEQRLPTGKLLVLTIVADLVDAYGDVAMARESYTALAPYADLFASNGAGGVAFTATVHTPLGMTAAAAGRLDDAVGHLRRGVAAAERAGAPVCAVLARLHLARVLDRRRRPGDAAEATALARVVVTEANRLGMTPTARRAETLIGEPTTSLTVRETEIARLVAQGLTNRQIAAVTHISERTVETHVARCLAKLHCATRARLVRAVLEADG